jgi:hypothetical protein
LTVIKERQNTKMAKKNKNQNTKRFLQSFSNKSSHEIFGDDGDDEFQNSTSDHDYDAYYEEDDQMEKINNNIRKKMKKEGF